MQPLSSSSGMKVGRVLFPDQFQEEETSISAQLESSNLMSIGDAL